MKKLNIFYWSVTGLFSAFMLMSGVTNFLVTQESVDLISTQLGYPEYIIPYIGLAKIGGSIIILIPGLNKIKEWAYAGLCFDLLGATYSLFKTSGLSAIWGMLPIIFFLFLSYYLLQRRAKALAQSVS